MGAPTLGKIQPQPAAGATHGTIHPGMLLHQTMLRRQMFAKQLYCQSYWQCAQQYSIPTSSGYSFTKSSVIKSCSSAATSTPVGPPPTITKDNSLRRSCKGSERHAGGAEAGFPGDARHCVWAQQAAAPLHAAILVCFPAAMTAVRDCSAVFLLCKCPVSICATMCDAV
jgi:hypothetical protein